MSVAKQLFPERIGTAIWVNVRTGSPDEGISLEVLRRQKFSLDALVGHASAGAALGYQFAQQGTLAVSVVAGVTHPYDGTLRTGWDPIVGLKLRF